MSTTESPQTEPEDQAAPAAERTEPVEPAGAGGRLCAFRQCRTPLPVQTGRGNRPRYCQDGRTWGPHDLTCKAAEAAFVAVDSLVTADSALTPAVVERLAAHLTDARDPLARLLDAVTTVGAQVGEETGAALASRDRALEAAAADRGAREAAEALVERYRGEAEAAGARAAEAVDLAQAAERAGVRAEADAAAALREQLRAEGRLAALADRLQRADELVEATAGQLAELRDRLAAVQATLQVTETTLAEERARATDAAERHRAELAARDAATATDRAEHVAALDRLRTQAATEAAGALDRLRAQAATDAAAAAEAAVGRRESALDALRAEHARATAQLAADHAAQLAELHRRLGATEHEAQELRARLAEETDTGPE